MSTKASKEKTIPASVEEAQVSPQHDIAQSNDIAESEEERRYNNLLRYFIPNLMTIFAICAGVTSIRLAFEGSFDMAIYMVLIAAILDGFDGRIARMIGGASSFGAQMDSLADNVNFGVAPGLLLYAYLLDKAPRFGWVAVLVYCVACCLRLARFNVMLEDKNIPLWKKSYFVGVPAPAGALLVMLPLYLGELGMPLTPATAIIGALYTLLIAYFLVSRLPVWSGKNIDPIYRRKFAVPFLLVIVASIGFAFTYTWQTLAFCAISYLAFLPLSVRYYYKTEQAYNQKAAP